MSKKKLSYKESLIELENIIKSIENDAVDVDEMNALVKRAAQLIQDCKKKLKGTEEDLNQTFDQIE